MHGLTTPIITTLMNKHETWRCHPRPRAVHPSPNVFLRESLHFFGIGLRCYLRHVGCYQLGSPRKFPEIFTKLCVPEKSSHLRNEPWTNFVHLLTNFPGHNGNLVPHQSQNRTCLELPSNVRLLSERTPDTRVFIATQSAYIQYIHLPKPHIQHTHTHTYMYESHMSLTNMIVKCNILKPFVYVETVEATYVVAIWSTNTKHQAVKCWSCSDELSHSTSYHLDKIWKYINIIQCWTHIAGTKHHNFRCEVWCFCWITS